MNAEILPLPTFKRSLRFFQYIGIALRAIATYLDGGTMPLPRPNDLAQAELEDAQIKLFIALRQQEQANHVVKYLEARINRLKEMRQ